MSKLPYFLLHEGLINFNYFQLVFVCDCTRIFISDEIDQIQI